MKFKRKKYSKAVYDELLDKDEFLRITTNLNGEYVLYHCYGLDENGITPLRSDKIVTTRTLAEAKAKAQELYAPKPEPTQTPIYADYSHVRLPYKD